MDCPLPRLLSFSARKPEHFFVSSKDGTFFRSRAVVCADGAESALGRKLGIVDAKANALCTWAYVKAGTHQMGMRDMSVIQPPDFPGFALLSRLPRDEICVSIYIRPGRCFVNSIFFPSESNRILLQDTQLMSKRCKVPF